MDTNLITWVVGYDMDDCPGSAMTTISRKFVEIEAPADREEAKKVAASYLDGLKIGARGRYLQPK